MEQFKENDEDGYDNPGLLKVGLMAALGGLFIYSVIAWIGMALIHR